MNASPSISRIPAEGHDRSLWFAVLGAPFLYLCHHELNYCLVLWACANGKRWILPAVSGVFLLLLLGSAGIAWQDFRRAPGAPDDSSPESPLNRHRLLSILGLMSAGLFFLLVLAQGIATLILDPCPE
jgi:hypothetical protein